MRRETCSYFRISFTPCMAQTAFDEAGAEHAADVNLMLYDAAPGTAILSYVVGHDHGVLFVLTRGETSDGPAHVTPYILPLKSSTQYEASRFHDECQNGEPSRNEAVSLYEALLQPAEKELAASSPAIRHVIIVPDGFLHQVPFHALVDGSRSFVVQRYAVSYAPSVTTLVFMHHLARTRHGES